MQYAIISAADTSSTLYARAKEWCETFADEWVLLSADGLVNNGSKLQPPHNADTKYLAQSVAIDARDQDWEDDATIYVLADPDQLDAETGDVFRRSLRVVLERLADEVVFPFDHLDPDRRGGWLVACLDDGEIKNPKNRYAVDTATDPDQRDLGSF